MKTVKLEDGNIKELLQRSQIDSNSVIDIVTDIINDVKNNGDEKIRQYTEKFDGVYLKDFLISPEDLEKSVRRIDKGLIRSLEKASSNIRKFHQAQLPQDWSLEVDKGITAGQIVRPLERVGCYIPGGRAVYPSSILMTVIPAKVAGVNEIICCTPPGPDGKVEDIVLAAAYLAGAHKVYRVGGAQAIAAMAYGTETIPAVDKIVGPGNIFVTAAKKMVYGQVDIDFPAGPSEVLIIADETGNPDYIALDLMAQAEHDPQAASVLVTTSPKLASAVNEKITEELPTMKRKEIISDSLEENGSIIVVSTMDEAVSFSNEYAPEHLIIMTHDPEERVKGIKNAGSIFLGDLTPVAAGDYGSGTNHVLPTSFCARMYSGLSTESFLKKPTVQRLSREGLNSLKDVVIPLAEYEGLYAHAESFKRRLDQD
ncbi:MULTISPECIES: histidinol dehydrogenase [Methanobacterium]|jgi:histidinol dehydrogenase|uniref:Histidinol dehydrogenase n=1 Tax=Methanobacterium subterraneum TaxID=59277 RepID=A0A2H4VE97_9EURY|nr:MULTISPECIES: histidinol dehydrogenase [Methanobacterium]AUB56417.1 histidinol dehydrogenase [Methanobacterium subterraneum]AUB58718.1 histidinol dehydrogenase [Methanobacterium sp. MZ-A1]MBW4257411.1 histidinol dehydrogenase [Methanobacterium sp. YSL]NMO08301.1 histidinol dehydrogenase [Methanobacterium subterraneum]